MARSDDKQHAPSYGNTTRDSVAATKYFLERIVGEKGHVVQEKIRRPDGTSYFRVTCPGESFTIADSNDVGNAMLIHRDDISTVSADEALGKSKQHAINNGCLRIVHPANFHTLSDEELEAFYNEKVLDALTR